MQSSYDEQESGMVILYFEPDRWQMTTRPYYGEMVKRILDTRRNAPLSPAALEVLAVIATISPSPAALSSRYAVLTRRPPSPSCWTRD